MRSVNEKKMIKENNEIKERNIIVILEDNLPSWKTIKKALFMPPVLNSSHATSSLEHKSFFFFFFCQQPDFMVYNVFQISMFTVTIPGSASTFCISYNFKCLKNLFKSC